ncbi:pyrimidine reductase family protein [Actinomycetospora straminea]|uniref:Bifunctional diaminohydroxyphosphoribosylaminopyrimidine deaminase/5-amino-6-(5-phosphoribosylamino)uracil reductase n=1 Tax=Actinomycetospora straminea TaxID=663607 RepID=A0ABP9DX73_9PSEU|nr:pyrimidine reductase family protein [Actinomycetospora straminea]MDD7934112.1 pyrimidine reductase family protein [Actinomycetospora straminea]
MRLVWPDGRDGELDRAALAEVYAYPADLARRDRPWVRANFVASADGAVAVGGVSGGLQAPGDGEVFGLLRELADVVLAGSGTVRAEGYRGARTNPALRERRVARGQAPVPPIAVVSTRGDLDPSAALFTDTTVAPLVLTAAVHAPRVRDELGGVAEVVPVSGDDPGATDPDAVVDALAARGLHRVLCEGGPALFGSLLAAGRVDELCLSVAPQLAGGGAERIVTGPALDPPRALRLAGVVAHDDGLLLRYRLG